MNMLKIKKRDMWQSWSLKRTQKTFITWLWSFLVSITGALILAFWDYKYHPTYSQLWLVPVGLILLTTPIVTWFAVLASEICASKDEDFSRAQSINSLGNSVQTGEVTKEATV